MKVPQEVLEALDGAEYSGNVMRLANQLERSLYTKTDKIIVAAGGKWDRRQRGHVFTCDAKERMEDVILTGEVVNRKAELQAFYTPADIAQMVVGEAEIENDMTVLEPSCGNGALVAEMPGGAIVTAIDVDSDALKVIRKHDWPHVRLILGDFLALNPGGAIGESFDRIIMNPPFARSADVAHVLHATSFLKIGGRLVAIMSSGIKFRRGRSYDALREIIDGHGKITDLPAGAFKSSGTMVNTVMVTIDL